MMMMMTHDMRWMITMMSVRGAYS